MTSRSDDGRSHHPDNTYTSSSHSALSATVHASSLPAEKNPNLQSQPQSQLQSQPQNQSQRYQTQNHQTQNHQTQTSQVLQQYDNQQKKQVVEALLVNGSLPPHHAAQVAKVLRLYPDRHDWRSIIDKALLIFGCITLALALVFFIAYNWMTMGTLSKFALVETALATSIIGYVVLAYKQKYHFMQQLLLLTASIITGSLLGLFGQVYQTGADTWQLFASWALFITPWVIIARMPTLWLLWVALINISFTQFVSVTGLFAADYALSHFVYLSLLFVFNLIALNLWLTCTSTANAPKPSSSKPSEFKNAGAIHTPIFKRARLHNIPFKKVSFKKVNYKKASSLLKNIQTVSDTIAIDKLSLHWSTYVMGFMSVYYATRLGIFHVIEPDNVALSYVSFFYWLFFTGVMYWRFRIKQIDLLMLTLLCGSAIVVVIFWALKHLVDKGSTIGFLILTLLVVGMSSAAVSWLNKLRKHHRYPVSDALQATVSYQTSQPQSRQGKDDD